ncbi:MAG: class I SAM-dependent methyltransferase [Deltaproteobacteria bacterium]|nr:class I SAM-dependent methyltransferase [Deltaproteobacteria bacterium]
MSFFGELYLRSTRPYLGANETRAEAELIARELALTPTTRTLDIGCGHGRHLELLHARCALFGLELDPLSIAQTPAPLRARVVRGDFYAPPFGPTFDAAFAWYATLFISSADERNLAALRSAAGVLKPGGKLLAHGHNPISQGAAGQSRFEATLPDGGKLVEETWYDASHNLLHLHRRLADGARVLEGRFAVRCPTVEDHAHWAKQSGLAIEATWGDAQGTPYGATSPDLIVRYRKLG